MKELTALDNKFSVALENEINVILNIYFLI
jgi:hypothetical protein